jgi:3-hydroxyacyl-[acyl-carrier-protein] dehydratase
MRFLFIDRVEKLEKGRRIVGAKMFSSSEAFLDRHFTKVPLIPGVLLIEMMAQLLGSLVIYSHDFRFQPILSLVGGARIPTMLKPGVGLEIEGTLLNNTERDSFGSAIVYQDAETIAQVDRIIFRHFPVVDIERQEKLFTIYTGIEDLAVFEPKE